MHPSQGKESLASRLVFALFDKLVLGLVVVCAGFWFQQRGAEQVMVRDLALKMAGLHGQIIQQERQALVEGVGTYLRTLTELERGKQLSKKRSEQLARSRHQIRASIENIDAVYDGFDEQAQAFMLAVWETSSTLSDNELTGGGRIQAIQARGSAIRREYKLMLASLRNVSVRAVQDDVRLVIESTTTGLALTSQLVAWVRRTFWPTPEIAGRPGADAPADASAG
jgi:hypothetical protein